jgi:acetylornithine/succinyldiaminopimelate/putrescine aminotransferase
MRTLFLKHLAPTSDMPLMNEIERAEGVYLYEKSGKRLMDLISGIAVSSLGHLNPEIKTAVHKQVDQYWHIMVYGEFVLSPQVKFAQLISSFMPPGLDSVYFTNSGTEATEGAMKLAKRATGRPDIIAAKNAYHGSTQGAASLMNPTDFTQAFHPLLPGIRHIEYNNEASLEIIDSNTAAVIVEPIQGESGVTLPSSGFLKKLKEKCQKNGALLIFDEAQTGFGRTGKMFAWQHWGVEPDIILLAKALGGGFPLGAFVSSRELMKKLSYDPVLGHITTFGGHPVSTAAGLAALDFMIKTDLVNEVEKKGQLFEIGLKHPAVLEMRRIGLMMALEVGSFEKVMKVVKFGLENGILVDWFLFNNTSIRLAPPLVISEEEIAFACKVLKEGLDQI